MVKRGVDETGGDYYFLLPGRTASRIGMVAPSRSLRT